MAERRMFTKKITDSDDFIAMPSAAQALYLHLNQGADDDGFNNQVQMAMFKAHASIDDLRVLLTKRFLIQFDNGVIVIKHWRMNNVLRKDRYTPTAFQEEIKLLKIKENGAYTINGLNEINENGDWLPNGCQVVDAGKDRIGKESIGNKNSGVKKFTPPSLEEVQAYIIEKNYTGFTAEEWINFYEAKNWYIGKNKMVNWKSAVNTWGLKERRKATEKPKTTNKFNQIEQNDYDFDAISKLMEG